MKKGKKEKGKNEKGKKGKGKKGKNNIKIDFFIVLLKKRTINPSVQ